MKLKHALNSSQARNAQRAAVSISHMKTQNTVSLFNSQVSGFARWQVENATAQTGVDFRACYFGTEISDKLFASLRERFAAGKLAAVKGGKQSVLIINGGFGVYGFNVTLAGDTYARKYGAQTLVGSLDALRAVYGKGNVTLGTVKDFEKLASAKKVHKDSELRFAKKAKSAKKAKAEQSEE
jgi:hypothetical protein